MSILFAHSLDHPALLGGGPRPGSTWIYLGTDEERRSRWAARLDPCARYADLSSGVDRAAAVLRKPYAAWVDGLGKRHGSDPDWWCASLSERNTYLSPLFLNACYLHAARGTLEGQGASIVVIAESWGVIAALRASCRAAGRPVTVANPLRGMVETFKQAAAVLGSWGIFFLRTAQRKAGARLSRPRWRPFPPSTKPRLLARTHLHDADISPDGQFRDRYFPDLGALAQRQGFELWLLPTQHRIRSLFRGFFGRLRAAKVRFIIQEDWLMFGDYVRSWACALKALRRPSGTQILEGLDITPLVREERRRQGGSRRSMEACLLQRLPSRLKNAGFQPDLIVDWYENQNISKALALGARRAYPGVPIRGFYSPSILPNLLNLFPTAAECAAKVVPDTVVCSSPEGRDMLLKESGGLLNVVLGSSPRYDYLWELSGKLRDRTEVGDAVLVALPHSLPASAFIVRVVAEAAEAEGRRRWFIKPHGDYGLGDLERSLPLRLPDRVRFVEGSLGQWMQQAGLFMTVGSWTAVEAMACGLPVILFRQPMSLRYDPFFWLPEPAVPECSKSQELLRRLEELDAEGEDARRSRRLLADRTLQACFVPPAARALEILMQGESPLLARP